MVQRMCYLGKLFKIVVKIILFGILAILLGLGGYVAVLAVSRSQPLLLPAPSGKYAVGRSAVDWVDPKRSDPLGGDSHLKRELAVWIWYPAQVDASAQPLPYLPPAWAQARNQDQGIGILIESNLTRIKTHSFAGVPVANGQPAYPVVMMQPGMGPSIPDYTVLAENLASQGYIVVGINPTYTSNLVTFTDGRVVPRSPLGTIPDDASPADADQIANRIMAVWAQDVIFGMDQLESLNANPGSPFYQRMTLEHIGVFGHSFGGATAISVCQVDTRCKAGADLDGTPFSAEAQADIPRPFLFMTEDYSQACDPYCESIRQMARKGPAGSVYNLEVKGAKHFNFSDMPLRWVPAVRPLFRAAGYTGSIDPGRGEQVTNAYLVAFFDRYLKGVDSPLLAGPSPDYPEVQFN